VARIEQKRKAYKVLMAKCAGKAAKCAGKTAKCAGKTPFARPMRRWKGKKMYSTKQNG
jgi:hypothetical protein